MSLPYDFDDDIKRIKEIAKVNGTGSAYFDGTNRAALLALPEKEFNRACYAAGSIARFSRSFERDVKAAVIERKNDYPKMIRDARKIFSEIDISILEHLDEELAYYTQYLSDEAGGQDLVATKKSLKKLKRKGLIELRNGLFNEDGETAGSGWMKIDHKLSEIQQICEVYRGPEQEALL